MTKKTALKILKKCYNCEMAEKCPSIFCNSCSYYVDDADTVSALEMAIKLLSQELEIIRCRDCIFNDSKVGCVIWTPNDINGERIKMGDDDYCSMAMPRKEH